MHQKSSEKYKSRQHWDSTTYLLELLKLRTWTPNAGDNVEWQELWFYFWHESKMVQPLWKRVWQFHTKWNILLLQDSAIVFLDIYPSELKTDVHIKTLVVQRLGLNTFTAQARVWSLVRKVRFCKLCCLVKKRQTCMWVFIVTVLITAKTLKLSFNRWMDKRWYT